MEDVYVMEGFESEHHLKMLRVYLYEYFPDIVFFDECALFLVFLYLLIEVSIVRVLHDDTMDISYFY